ncbi:MAG: response regulator transcription factor [Methylococcaceae bacterium]|nr:MAG: response regulator transcription factor [Methylococcaceae bacterium]
MNNEGMSLVVVSHDRLLYKAIGKAVGEWQVRLRQVNSHESALQAVAEGQPNIVLIDAETPGMDVGHTCQILRNEAEPPNLEIILISDDDSTAGRIAAYNDGADDYVTKPLHFDELLSKLSIALRRQQRHLELNSFAQMASQTAMMAMTNAGELGVLLQFLKQSFDCHDYRALAAAAAAALNQYSLSATVQIRTDQGDSYAAAYEGDVTPLAESIIDQLRSQGRIFDFNQRTIFNYPNISVLVKNMPLDDPERYGRMKDHVAMLAEGAQARVQAIQAELELAHKKTALETLLESTNTALLKIEQTYQKHRTSSMEIVGELMSGLEQLFILLGLSEPQEQQLYNLVKEAVDRNTALYDEGLQTDELFEDILRLLDYFLHDR